MKPQSSVHVLAISSVYAAALLQGLTLVSFPASSTVLKHMLHLSDAQYGSIFLPQVAMAIVGAVAGGALANRLGLKTLLLLALLANALSQIILFESPVLPIGWVFGALLAGTSFLGLGFGLSGAPLNTLPTLYFPKNAQSAVAFLHTLLGAGLALGPFWVSQLVNSQTMVQNHWQAFPAGLLVACGVLFGLVLFQSFKPAAALKPAVSSLQTAAIQTDSKNLHPSKSLLFWLFALAAVLYSFAEGTFSNWAVIYLNESKQLPLAVASQALSGFWLMIALGRLAVSFLVLKIAAHKIWLALPVLMLLTFLALPGVHTASSGIGLFALAGLACSGFFPLSVGLVSQRFSQHTSQYTSWVSAMMTAALMTGVGLGSFIVGPLRSFLPLETLYQLSIVYPLGVLALASVILKQQKSSVDLNIQLNRAASTRGLIKGVIGGDLK